MEVIKVLTTVLFALVVLGVRNIEANQPNEDDFYTAGVLEYSYLVSNKSMEESVELNVNEYVRFIELAKRKNVDVLVFPEATLNHDFIETREQLSDYAVVTPDPKLKIAPYEHENDYSSILVKLSKAAKDNQIYVLVNLIEKMLCTSESDACKPPHNVHNDGYCLYNTNVVFDRKGRLISRYRKVNLYIEPRLDEPSEQPLPIFETDFGVKFGHFICFDVMFKYPSRILVQQENITNILYPTYWYAGLPFFIAETIHQGWAYSNNVNFIVSGANVLHFGISGAGIYFGRKRIQAIETKPDPVRKLYTAKVPKNIRADIKFEEPQIREESSAADLLRLNVSENWVSEYPIFFPLNEPQETVCVNDNKICCTVEVKRKDLKVPDGALSYKYALNLNYSTKLYIERRNMGEISCAIVACTGEAMDTCGKRFHTENVAPGIEFEHIKITAKIRSDKFEDVMIQPNTVTTGLLPFDVSNYTLTETDVFPDQSYNYKNFTIESTTTVSEFLVFGMYGRDFSMDHDKMEDIARFHEKSKRNKNSV
ncbi:vanin-like protein 1 [Hermetia illucens]|uniref:vanin-like protein 1 n=1 Tax=Hermetia illucens TaxID=343691 RepID=UPI0018CBFE4D|nr:vanin-like protein 1 [Hermetia illucens]